MMGLVSVDLLEDIGAEKLVLDAAPSAVLLRSSLLGALVEELTEPAKSRDIITTRTSSAYLQPNLSLVPHCAQCQ